MLYPLNSVFVSAFTHWSLFAWSIAGFIRLTHLSMGWALLIAHLVSIALFLFACRQLAFRLFNRESTRWCAVLLAAACFTLPVAGTALVLMDPYVTARSFSTPLSLIAVAACLDSARLQSWIRTALLLAVTAAVHPLMAAYATAFIVLYAWIAAGRTRIAVALCALAVAGAGIAFAFAHRRLVNPDYREAVLLAPRAFLFLARWRWYEDLGLVLPLLLFGVAWGTLRPPRPTRDPKRNLCLTCIVLGVTSTIIAALFVSPSGPYPLVPLQVLRSFHLIYAIGMVLAAGPVAALLGRFRTVTVVFFALLFVGISLAEPLSWPDCRRIEWPGAGPVNPYQQAFLWIRSNTPRNAVFAFNPQLVYVPNEDEQGFRANARRDHLADDKDAGIAAVLPFLATRWATQRNPAFSVDKMSDHDRRAVLQPLGATWLLLPPEAPTDYPCLWQNSVAKICRITP
jgi:hypothetical protein